MRSDLDTVQLPGTWLPCELLPAAGIPAAAGPPAVPLKVFQVVTVPFVLTTGAMLQPSTIRGTVLLFTMVIVHDPVARVQVTSAVESYPRSTAGVPTGPFAVVWLVVWPLGKAEIATNPIPRAATTAMMAVSPIRRLYSANLRFTSKETLDGRGRHCYGFSNPPRLLATL